MKEKRYKKEIILPENVKKIHEIFKKYHFQLYLVGGCVRDAILDLKPKDWDLVTNANPDSVITMLKDRIFVKNILETGKAFGIVNVITTDEEYEIATMRKDIGTGRRPDSVEFTNIEQDIMRRDVTINALFYDIDKSEIVDLVGGVDDLKKGIVKTVGSPQERFGEDRLRILRAIRFAARFGSNLDPEADAALRKDANLEGISGERIRDEFLKGIISAKSITQFIGMIEKYNLFDWIFRGLNINKNFISDKDPILVIASLLKDNDPKLLGKKLNDLKYTVDEIKNINFLVNLSNLTPETAVIFKRMQKLTNLADDQIKKFGIQQGLNPKLLDAFIKFRLTVNGEDLMKQLNLKPGKELGDAISKAEYENFKKLF